MRINNWMRMSGLALTVAAGYSLACTAPQKSNLGALYLRNLGALTKIVPHGASDADTAMRPADLPANPPTIVGLWHVQYTQGSQVVDEVFDLWHADGTEIGVDTTPPVLGNVCNGVWSQTGTLTYKLTHPSFLFDQNGQVSGTVMIRNVVNLDLRGDTFSGTFTVDVFDNNSKLVDHEEGKLTATRVKPS